MTTTAFADLTSRQQAHRLRRAATTALGQYAIDEARLHLVVHDFNATFRVDTASGDRFALRINTNSPSGLDAVRAEAAWVAHLVDDPSFDLPVPVRARSGDLVVATVLEDHAAPVPAVLYRWLDGPNLGARVSASSVAAIGRAAAAIHRRGRDLPNDIVGARPRLDDVMMGSPDVLAAVDAGWFDAELREVIAQARERIDRLAAPVLREPDGMIHADLHPWNVKWRRGRLAVFDFDDCGPGAPLFELAISAYYFRRAVDDGPLFDGYRSVAPLPDHDPAAFEALVASRAILLLNDVAGTTTATHRDLLPEFAERTRRRLRHWLDTGRFRPDV